MPRVIYYTGIGANLTGQHTEEEFISIMKNEFQHQSWSDMLTMYDKKDIVELNFGNWILPDDFCFFTLQDWIDYSGAEFRDK